MAPDRPAGAPRRRPTQARGRAAARQTHRARVRYRRLLALGTSLGITLVAVLGGIGVLPDDAHRKPHLVADTTFLTSAPASVATSLRAQGAEPGPQLQAADRGESREVREVETAPPPVPADSGTGRRVVFDQESQRVWLVSRTDRVRRTYPVSGSVDDNLDKGTYEVYSRSMRAWGIDDSGTMKYMVRFAHGERAAIGFHDIPVKDGEKLQTRAELGVPRSHGCIRQWRRDAKALWRFAPIGTTVVVV